MARVIFENNIKELALSLKKNGIVFVPAKTRPDSTFGQYSFTKLEKETDLAIDYPTTNLPPKEFLLPPEDVLFVQNGEKIEKPKVQKQVIFGLSIEDLDGLEKLNKIFNKPIQDEHFSDVWDATILVGIDNFSPPKNINFDLYLQRINSELYVGHAGSKIGSEILKSSFFKTQELKIPKVTKKVDELISNPELPKIIEKSKNHPVWKELAQICFGCGICSFVCPLCYCFETEDKIDITKEKMCSERCRNWDSCMLSSFSQTNAGNFRPELSDRIYNWYFHKFVRMQKEYKFPGCVDCNRCTIYCPAKINYRKILTRLVSDWEAKK